MALVAEQLVASSESSGFPSFICLKQEQGRASIRAGDLTTNYSIFVGSGEISIHVGVIQHLNIGQDGMLGNKSHQASGSLIHFLVCCYIPTFSAEISTLGRSIVSHICCSPRRWLSVSIGTDPRIFKPVPQLQALTLASAGSFEPSGTACLSKKNYSKQMYYKCILYNQKNKRYAV